MVRATCLVMSILACSAAGQELPIGGAVQTPIEYKRGMLVCVTASGAAAVRFIEPFALGNETGNGVVGVSYEWRFLPADMPNGKEVSGSGKVFSKLKDNQPIKDSSEIKCGPIHINWRFESDGIGLIEFDPDIQAVHTFSETSFAGFTQPQVRPPLDLNAFLRSERRPPLDLGVLLRSERMRIGNDARNVAGLIRYKDTATLVRDELGVTVFEFKEVFERQPAPDEVHQGVGYEFEFIANTGARETGAGEVYELRKDNRYNGPGSQLNLRGGPTKVKWSMGGNEDGWLYYDLGRARVWTCRLADKEKLLQVIANSPGDL